MLRCAGKLYAGATLQSFKLHGTYEEQRRQRVVLDRLKDYCDGIGRHIDNGHNVIFTGSCGTGKDHLMVGMVREAIKAGCYEIQYATAYEIYDSLREAIRGNTSQAEVLGDLYRPKLLIISDVLPMNNALTDYEGEMLFRLLDTRHRRLKATWVNINVKSRAEAVAKIGEKILDRLEADGFTLTFEWADYRLKGG